MHELTALPLPPEGAHRLRGASFVKIFQNRIVYNDGAFSDFAERKTAPESQIFVEHGKRPIFGREEDRGLRLSPGTLSLEVVAPGDDGVGEADIPVHDRTNRTLAGMLAEMNPPDFPAALGVLYCQPEEGCEAAVYAQVEEAKAAAGRSHRDRRSPAQRPYLDGRGALTARPSPRPAAR